MKILLISIGTRGDIDPFLALTEILRNKGHKVICSFPEQFRNLVIDSGVEFFSLGPEYIEILDSDYGKAAMGGAGSSLRKLISYIKFGFKSKIVNKELISRQHRLVEELNPDKIIYNSNSIYPIIWEVNHPDKTVFISPIPNCNYRMNHSHIAFASNFGSFFNKLSYSLINFVLAVIAKTSVKWLEIDEKPSLKQIRKLLASRKVIYTISPTLYPKPDYWGGHLRVLGYHERNIIPKWHPDNELLKFMTLHNKIVFITFGSMCNSEPEKKTKIIVEILERNNIPAIINTVSGGLTKIDNVNSTLIHFVSKIPYAWIFPKIYAVVHHGGSGTTHMALKCGCASLIIPHIADQFFWNDTIYNIGAGPKGTQIGKFTVSHIEAKIIDLVTNTTFKVAAERVSTLMNKENYSEILYQSLIE